jgi:hypothetical protein
LAGETEEVLGENLPQRHFLHHNTALLNRRTRFYAGIQETPEYDIRVSFYFALLTLQRCFAELHRYHLPQML